MSAPDPNETQGPPDTAPAPVREKPSGLTMGRVVRFMPEDGGVELTAVIVDVLDDFGDTTLFVMARSIRDTIRGAYGTAPGLAFAQQVRYDPTGLIPRSWHFPGRVP